MLIIHPSNIVVFRKGGYLAANERVFYNDCRMKVVNLYKYPGICFSTKHIVVTMPAKIWSVEQRRRCCVS